MEDKKIEYATKALVFSDEKEAHSAFLVIVRSFHNKLYHSVQNWIPDEEEAKDVLQETWIKVWRYRLNFKGESNLYSWIYRIAHNESMNYWRKKKQKPTVQLDDKLVLTEKGFTYPVSSEEIGIWLADAINQLPEKQRIVFEHRYFDEMSYEEISQLIGGSIGGLKANYFHAAQKVEEFVRFQLNQKY